MIFVLCAAILVPAIILHKEKPDETILARIGDKDISIKEFLWRSELTIRPSNFKSKKTTLNNLISEKILALEAQRDKKLSKNPVLLGAIKGIKEQAMRSSLYKEVAYDKVQLDSNEISKVYKLSQREYELEFYTIRNKAIVQKIETLVDSLPGISDKIFSDLADIAGEKPVHKVAYKDQDDEVIQQALYSNPLKLGSTIGPLKLSNGEYIIMKVLNWTDYPVIGYEDQRIRWNKVKEKIHQAKANQLWRAYRTDLMQGKKIEFNEQTFKAVAKLVMQKYLNDAVQDSLNYQLRDLPSAVAEIDPQAPFFTADDTAWSVDDFKQEILSHPLVFRTKYLDQNNFNHQFQLAIVDLMRDHYLTREAYRKSLDDSPEIARTAEMWQDAYLAVQQEKNIIDSARQQGLINTNNPEGTRIYWESYVRDLQKKYSASVYINGDALDKISLTKIDLIALQPGLPYPVMMPNFPTFIGSDNLDYIKKEKVF
jgi:hypothetical protein